MIEDRKVRTPKPRRGISWPLASFMVELIVVAILRMDSIEEMLCRICEKKESDMNGYLEALYNSAHIHVSDHCSRG